MDPAPLGALSLSGSSQLNLTETSRAAMDIFDASWSSLQGLASSFLGSDVKETAKGADKTSKPYTRKKASLADSFSVPRSITRTTSSWGPKGSSALSTGLRSYEERQAYLQAKKRETLLLPDADSASDIGPGHKRRVSSDLPDQSAADPDQDEGALVYIHHVDQNDTISGVTIRYGCQTAMFRKANGFWPSDSIQSRRTVLVPVAFCSVKGRPIRPPPNVDLLGDIHGDLSEDPSSSSISPVPVQSSNVASSEESSSLNAKPENEKDRTWKHESWVEIDGFPKPVEIGRVPRKTLGFFPRTRRKSLQQADSSRSSTSTRDQSGLLSSRGSPERQPSANVAPKDGSDTPAGLGIRRQRRRSSLHLADRGVGTLDNDASNPGPSQDKLNQFVAQHIPGLAPRAPTSSNQQRSSFESGSSSTTNASTSLDNFGGMLEGWVRKVAQRAKTNINEWQQQNPQQGGRGYEQSGLSGDLIELDNTSSSRASQRSTSLTRPAMARDVSSSSASLRRQFVGSSAALSRTRSDLGLKDD